jgi:hypothetical protein
MNKKQINLVLTDWGTSFQKLEVVVNAFISHFNKQKMHIMSSILNIIATFYLKTFNLAGFKPGSSVSEEIVGHP